MDLLSVDVYILSYVEFIKCRMFFFIFTNRGKIVQSASIAPLTRRLDRARLLGGSACVPPRTWGPGPRDLLRRSHRLLACASRSFLERERIDNGVRGPVETHFGASRCRGAL